MTAKKQVDWIIREWARRGRGGTNALDNLAEPDCEADQDQGLAASRDALGAVEAMGNLTAEAVTAEVTAWYEFWGQDGAARRAIPDEGGKDSAFAAAERLSAFMFAAGHRTALDALAASEAELTSIEHEVAMVYDHLTFGKFSKANTMAQYVIEAVEEQQRKDSEEDIKEAVLASEAECERLRTTLDKIRFQGGPSICVECDGENDQHLYGCQTREFSEIARAALEAKR